MKRRSWHHPTGALRLKNHGSIAWLSTQQHPAVGWAGPTSPGLCLPRCNQSLPRRGEEHIQHRRDRSRLRAGSVSLQCLLPAAHTSAASFPAQLAAPLLVGTRHRTETGQHPLCNLSRVALLLLLQHATTLPCAPCWWPGVMAPSMSGWVLPVARRRDRSCSGGPCAGLQRWDVRGPPGRAPAKGKGACAPRAPP